MAALSSRTLKRSNSAALASDTTPSATPCSKDDEIAVDFRAAWDWVSTAVIAIRAVQRIRRGRDARPGR